MGEAEMSQPRNTQRDSFDTELSEMLERVDLDNLEEAIEELNHENGAKRTLAFRRLQMAGERSIEPLLQILRQPDKERLGSAIEILWIHYEQSHILHPDYPRLLYSLIGADVAIHHRRAALELLSAIQLHHSEKTIHQDIAPYLFDEDKGIRERAIFFYIQNGIEGLIPYLVLLLETADNSMLSILKDVFRNTKRADVAYAFWEYEKRNQG
jgi:hypothetical protein